MIWLLVNRRGGQLHPSIVMDPRSWASWHAAARRLDSNEGEWFARPATSHVHYGTQVLWTHRSLVAPETGTVIELCTSLRCRVARTLIDREAS